MDEELIDDGAVISAPRHTRYGVVVVVVLLHVLAIAALIQAFAPDFTARVADQIVSTFTVTVETTPPSPEPEAAKLEKAGAAAAIGKKANPKAAAAPKPKIAIAPAAAPPVAAKGADNAAGAANQGAGTGAGGQGQGRGSGNGGDGTGGGAVSKAVKIAGDINSARDYPRETRDQRLGHSVTVALTVGTDGRVRNCRIHKASSDPQSDQITCRLATERFRFRPATNSAGEPVESVYGWQQRWFYPGGAN